MKKNFSDRVICRKCANISNMEIIASCTWEKKYKVEDVYGPPPSDYFEYEILLCPACEQQSIQRSRWNDVCELPDEVDIDIIFPEQEKIPIGLPKEILSQYVSAQKVALVDSDAYIILLRRLLESICINRNVAEGKLFDMLEELEQNGEIPRKLVAVAKNIRIFGNVAAHQSNGKILKKEISLATDLMNALLEYIYSAPYLVNQAERKLVMIKKRK